MRKPLFSVSCLTDAENSPQISTFILGPRFASWLDSFHLIAYIRLVPEVTSLDIRKLFVTIDETRHSLGESDGRSLRRVAACAVIGNPFAGRGYVADLSGLVEPSAALGQELGQLARASLADQPESYGKAAIVGTSGEQEHAVACLTSKFGDAFRQAIGGGAAWISSATKLGGTGASIDVPLAYKDEIWVRSHYDAIEVRVPDAPLPDEIVVIAALANRGRVNSRLGGLTIEEARERANR